jgi:hypothetical protein
MNQLPIITKSILPTYGTFDIIGNTVGRYFDYKKDTAMIKYETEKLKTQAKVIVRKIDTVLTLSLDENTKNFNKEMSRLKSISKELKHGRKTKSDIMKNISRYSKLLSDANTPLEVKSMIPKLIHEASIMLKVENELSLKKLNLMSYFESDVKLLGSV